MQYLKPTSHLFEVAAEEGPIVAIQQSNLSVQPWRCAEVVVVEVLEDEVAEVEGLELDLADDLLLRCRVLHQLVLHEPLILEHVEEVGLVAVVVADDDDDLMHPRMEARFVDAGRGVGCSRRSRTPLLLLRCLIVLMLSADNSAGLRTATVTMEDATGSEMTMMPLQHFIENLAGALLMKHKNSGQLKVGVVDTSWRPAPGRSAMSSEASIAMVSLLTQISWTSNAYFSWMKSMQCFDVVVGVVVGGGAGDESYGGDVGEPNVAIDEGEVDVELRLGIGR
jgi:hypothetical protein